MPDFNHLYNEDGQIIHTETNKHGDQKVVSTEEVKLKFRYITELDKATNRESVMASSDAIIWVDPSLDVDEGSIFYVEEKYWRVDKLVRAKRITGNGVLFLKCFVNKHIL